jgi:signal peptidase I
MFVDKLLYWRGGPARGDIVVLEPPDAPGQHYIKRIIGLPGDTVQLQNGQVLVNGQVLHEQWPIRQSPGANWGPATVGAGQYFVLGDNRPGSRDSRYFGMLDRSRITGRAFLCYWPPQKWTTFPRYTVSQLGLEVSP